MAKTLETVLVALYDDFLQTDSPELLRMSELIADRILQDSKPDKTCVLTQLSDLMCNGKNGDYLGIFE